MRSAQHYAAALSSQRSEVDQGLQFSLDVQPTDQSIVPTVEELADQALSPGRRGKSKRRASIVSTAAPARADVLALRPAEQAQLRPPRRFTRQEKLDWLVQQYRNGVTKTAAAFTLAQLRALNTAIDKDAGPSDNASRITSSELRNLSKPALAARLVQHPRGWAWRDPSDLVARFAERDKQSAPFSQSSRGQVV